MNNEALNKFITTMTDMLNSAKDFTLAQAPDIFRQIIQWKMAVAIATIVLSLAGIAIASWLGVRCLRENQKPYGEQNEFMTVAPGIIGIVPGIFGVIGVFDQGASLLQIYFAPKTYLIEYFSHLVRK